MVWKIKTNFSKSGPHVSITGDWPNQACISSDGCLSCPFGQSDRLCVAVFLYCHARIKQSSKKRFPQQIPVMWFSNLEREVFTVHWIKRTERVRYFGLNIYQTATSFWTGQLSNKKDRIKPNMNELGSKQTHIWIYTSSIADDVFKWKFFNGNIWISIKISPKFVPKGPINTIPTLIQIMLGTDQATSRYLNQWWFHYRGIYASLGLNELKDGSLQPLSHWILNICIKELDHHWFR